MLLIRHNWIFRTSDNLILLPIFLLVIQTFFLLCHNLQLVLFLYNLQPILQFLIAVYGIIGHTYDNIVWFVLSKCNLCHIHKTDTSFCSACCFGKIHKFPFSSSEIIYTKPLKLVHSDLGVLHRISHLVVINTTFTSLMNSLDSLGSIC